MPDDTPDTPIDSVPLDTGLHARIEQLEKQVADYKLLIADFENARKRLAADHDRQRKYAAEPLARDLLSGLDNLERAVEASKKSGDATALSQGVSATIALFLDILKRYGVNRIDVAPGSTFDPNLHQAVMEQPTNDVAPGQVAAVFQAGFLLHDRVLRPASVAVATEPPAGSV